MKIKYFTKRSLTAANKVAKKHHRNYLDEEFVAGISIKKRFPIYNGIPLETGWMRVNVGVGDDEQFHSLWFDVRLKTLEALPEVEVRQ